MTLLLLVLVFIVGPIVELYVIIQVAQVIGGWETMALLIVESILGAWLMKRQGRGVLARIQTSLDDGRMPTKELVDGGLILFAGALMLTPGFITDILGFVLLVPPTARAGAGRAHASLQGPPRHRATRSSAARAVRGVSTFTFGRRGDVYDTTAREQGRRHELP